MHREDFFRRWWCAREERVGPEQAGGAAEGSGDGGDQEQLDTEWVEGTGGATEEARRVIRQAADGVVGVALRHERADRLREPANEPQVQRGAEDGHADAQRRLMGQAADHFVPIAETENSGEEEIAGAGEQIERGENPKKK